VSDPNAATMSQKVVQYQAVLQLAQQAPQLYDMGQLHRQMLEVLGIKNAKKLVKIEDDQMPEDPITENMNLLTMKPVKAFLYQDHQAHITVHMNAMKDPKIAALVGQNPQAQAIQAAALAHIQQHLAFEYRKQMEQIMQVQLPNPEDDENMIPRDQEVQLSMMAAQASDALLQRNQTEIAAQQAEQAKQDPVIQMQAQELQLKQAEEQRKAAKDQADVQEAAARMELERERIASQERIAAAQIQAKVGKDQAEIEIKTIQAMNQANKPQTGNRQ
jgi:hypothetical protein